MTSDQTRISSDQTPIAVTVGEMQHRGDFVSVYNGKPIFLRGVIPGERVLVAPSYHKSHYSRGQVLRVLSASPHRVLPLCSVTEMCGCCPLMHVRYGEQLRLKRLRVEQDLSQAGILDSASSGVDSSAEGGSIIRSCFESEAQLYYRHKVQVPITCSKRRFQFGMFRPGSRNFVSVDHCLVHDTEAQRLLNKAISLLSDMCLKGVISQEEADTLRYILIRRSFHSAQSLVSLVGSKDISGMLATFASKMINDDAVGGVLLNINQDGGNAVLGEKTLLLEGRPYIEERIGGMRFRCSVKSFFQVNVVAASRMFDYAVELAGLTEEKRVLDLYCGTGVLSLLAAARCKEVIGVEVVEEAVVDARQNALDNGVQNARFISGQTGDVLNRVLADQCNIDSVFLNPPRRGCGEEMLISLSRIAQRTSLDRIVYISCNSSTFAMDAACMDRIGFKLQAVQPFDLFPQTPHVEVVGLFTRVSSVGCE